MVVVTFIFKDLSGLSAHFEQHFVVYEKYARTLEYPNFFRGAQKGLIALLLFPRAPFHALYRMVNGGQDRGGSEGRVGQQGPTLKSKGQQGPTLKSKDSRDPH